MKEGEQHFCGECGATEDTKYCIKPRRREGRVEVTGRVRTLQSEPIETCATRLEKMEDKNAGERTQTAQP